MRILFNRLPPSAEPAAGEDPGRPIRQPGRLASALLASLAGLFILAGVIAASIVHSYFLPVADPDPSYAMPNRVIPWAGMLLVFILGILAHELLHTTLYPDGGKSDSTTLHHQLEAAAIRGILRRLHPAGPLDRHAPAAAICDYRAVAPGTVSALGADDVYDRILFLDFNPHQFAWVGRGSGGGADRPAAGAAGRRFKFSPRARILAARKIKGCPKSVMDHPLDRQAGPDLAKRGCTWRASRN